MRKRILILPVAAVVIVALCAYRIATIDRSTPSPTAPAGRHFPVGDREMFILSDENNHTVRLKSYLGRHQILLVFFDARGGPGGNPVLTRLRRDFEKIAATNTKIFAISSAIPQENRKSIQQSGGFPFPLLTDLNDAVRANWGVVNTAPESANGTMYFIDRAGNVDHGAEFPRPVTDPQTFLDRLIADS